MRIILSGWVFDGDTDFSYACGAAAGCGEDKQCVAEGIALHSNDDIVEEEKEGGVEEDDHEDEDVDEEDEEDDAPDENKKKARKSVEVNQVSRVLETIKPRPNVFHVGGQTRTPNLGGPI